METPWCPKARPKERAEVTDAAAARCLAAVPLCHAMATPPRPKSMRRPHSSRPIVRRRNRQDGDRRGSLRIGLRGRRYTALSLPMGAK